MREVLPVSGARFGTISYRRSARTGPTFLLSRTLERHSLVIGFRGPRDFLTGAAGALIFSLERFLTTGLWVTERVHIDAVLTFRNRAAARLCYLRCNVTGRCAAVLSIARRDYFYIAAGAQSAQDFIHI